MDRWDGQTYRRVLILLGAPDDVGARGHLGRWLGLEEPLDYASVRRIIARWQPYAGLVYFHLLLKRVAESGYVS